MSAGVADRSNVLHFWQCHEPIVSSFIATGTRFSSYSILRACRTRANLAMHTGPIWIGWSARTQLASLVSAGGALLRQTPISGRIGLEAAHGHKACEGATLAGAGGQAGRCHEICAAALPIARMVHASSTCSTSIRSKRWTALRAPLPYPPPGARGVEWIRHSLPVWLRV